MVNPSSGTPGGRQLPLAVYVAIGASIGLILLAAVYFALFSNPQNQTKQQGILLAVSPTSGTNSTLASTPFPAENSTLTGSVSVSALSAGTASLVGVAATGAGADPTQTPLPKTAPVVNTTLATNALPTPTNTLGLPTPTNIPIFVPPPGLQVSADQAAIEKAFIGLPGDKSAVVILPDGKTISNNPDLRLPSASVIKLWIVATIFDTKAAGKLNLAETYTIKTSDIAPGTGILSGSIGKTFSYDQLISTMLIYSDNSAANILLNKIGGINPVNVYISRNGYKQTVIQRFLGDVNNINNNFTSAQDCAVYMQHLLKGEIVDKVSSERIVAILRARRADPKDAPLNYFGRKLPSSVDYFHISGNGAKTRNEVGYFDVKQNGPVITAILTSNVPDESAAENSVANTVLQVYQGIK